MPKQRYEWKEKTMPNVTVLMYKGRSMDQKRAMVKAVTDAIADTLGVDAERVRIYIEERSKDDIAHGGEILSDMEKTT